jgi:hypothetical protein
MVTPLVHNHDVSGPQNGVVGVIGQCVVASCHRPAVTHVILDVGGCRVAGSVCEHCQRATMLGAFLLAL